MRVSIPITITKAEPQLVKQYLGGETDNTVLGVMKPNGDIALLMHDNKAIIVDGSDSIQLLPDFANDTFTFSNTDENAPSEFVDDYEWLDISVLLQFYNVGDYRQCCFFIKSLVGYVFDLCVYDWNMTNEDDEADIRINLWQVPVEVDPATTFITATRMQNHDYLALSINGIVKPLCDINRNGGCEITADGATFEVLACNNVGAGGRGLNPIPQGVALCDDWDVDSCSVDGGNVTTKLITTVYTMGYELGIQSVEKTDAPGTWHLLPSMFSVQEI